MSTTVPGIPGCSTGALQAFISVVVNSWIVQEHMCTSCSAHQDKLSGCQLALLVLLGTLGWELSVKAVFSSCHCMLWHSMSGSRH